MYFKKLQTTLLKLFYQTSSRNLGLLKVIINCLFWVIVHSLLFIFFLIGNQKTIIKEKKGKVQDVHDDEHQEKIEQTTQQKEKSGN